MSYAGIEYKEIRIVIQPELTQVYVLIDAIGDCPIGVQGWHHKTFPASKNASEIVGSLGQDDPVLWPLNAPETGRTK